MFYSTGVLASTSCSGLGRAGKIIMMQIRFAEVRVFAFAFALAVPGFPRKCKMRTQI
jgi:hypothetical protein